MGIGAALIAPPAGWPGGAEGGHVPELGDILGRLREVCATAAGDAALLGFAEAAEFAGRVEEASRALEYLQVVAAGAVDRTRREAAADGAPALDDGHRRTGEFLRDRLQISAAEAHRRLTLAGAVLPRTGITGQPLAPRHEELAAAVAAGTVPSRSATIISQALERVRPLSGPDTSARMEHALTATAVEHDPDFLARIARRWMDAIDQDGAEPAEEVLRQLQGAFLRKPRHGLHHLEIFATTAQYEHLLTVMNTATNPRTIPGGTGTGSPDGAGEDCGGEAGADGFVPGSLDRRSRPQKLLDGLVGACKAAMASGALPAAGGLRPQVMATIDYRDLLDRLHPRAATDTATDTGTGTGTGTLAFTGPVTAATIRTLACDADILPVLLGSQSRILDIGRTTRLFPPHLRKAITARDQGCAFPSCTIPAPWCEAHHITYWSQGGTTSADNGTLLCSHHHHLIHKEQWTIQPRHGIPWFIPPPHLDPHQTPQRNHYFRS